MKMAERDFPAVFSDGVQEINMGTVRVQSSFTYKTFQLLLSQMIGISPNQITTYIVDHRTLPDFRRRIPVTNKTNFSLLARETECHFLVVLKRTKRSKRAASDQWRREVEFAERMHELQIQRENFEAAMSAAAVNFPTIRESFSCKECLVARRHRMTADFHHCICDAAVAKGFRSTAGPIAPPRKQLAE